METVILSSRIYTGDPAKPWAEALWVKDGKIAAVGGNKSDPNHQYLLCDIEDGCTLHPLTEETGAPAPSVSPDGKNSRKMTRSEMPLAMRKPSSADSFSRPSMTLR